MCSRDKFLSVFPFDNSGNQYISIQKNIYAQLGLEVEAAPRNLADLVNFLQKKFFKKENKTIVINWFEDVATSNGIKSFIPNLIWLLIIRILYHKVIYVKHNFQPHSGRHIFLFKLTAKIMKMLSDLSVSHRPVDGCKYIPHPCYPYKNSTTIGEYSSDDYLIFGQVKAYKGIEELVHEWPEDKGLFIFGKCEDKQLSERIKSIIKEKKTRVYFFDKYIDDDELVVLLNSFSNVVLPHYDDRMIVSGGFYHAASFGCNIVMRETGFYDYCISNFSFVSSINELIKKSLNIEVVPRDIVFQELVNVCGNDVLMVEWKKLLSNIN